MHLLRAGYKIDVNWLTHTVTKATLEGEDLLDGLRAVSVPDQGSFKLCVLYKVKLDNCMHRLL